MNGLRDFVVCARDGLCGGTRRRVGGIGGGGVGGTIGEDDDCWDVWPPEEPTPPPVPKVIHVSTVDDADDDLLFGLDFVDSGPALPSDLLLREQPPMGCYAFQRSSRGGHADYEKEGCRSSASSLSASTDTDHAQIFHAWTPAPNAITTMAYVFPQRQGKCHSEAAVAVSDVDGSSYSSRDSGHYWLTKAMPQSFLKSSSPPTPPTEVSSVASF